MRLKATVLPYFFSPADKNLSGCLSLFSPFFLSLCKLPKVLFSFHGQCFSNYRTLGIYLQLSKFGLFSEWKGGPATGFSQHSSGFEFSASPSVQEAQRHAHRPRQKAMGPGSKIYGLTRWANLVCRVEHFIFSSPPSSPFFAKLLQPSPALLAMTQLAGILP